MAAAANQQGRSARGRPAALANPRLASLARRLNSPLGVAVLTALGYGLYTFVRLALLHGDITRFVVAGGDYIPVTSGRAVGLSVQPSAGGYDGQFYYLLALNPFSARPALPGAVFDIPAYRAQRILYPLLVWALSLGGRPALAPIMLVVVNLASIIAIGALAAMLARRFNAAPAWGLLVAAYPGLLLSLARDLAEPLALACALAGLLFVLDRRWGWAAVALSLAVLARETTALFAVALLLIALVERIGATSAGSALRRRYPLLAAIELPSSEAPTRSTWPSAALAGSCPLGIALLWQIVLLLHWGRLGALAAGSNNIGFPLLGLVEGFVAWRMLWSAPLQALQSLDVLYLLGLAEATRRTLVHHWRWPLLSLAWALYVALTLCLSVFVWDYYWNFMRGAMELATLSLLLLVTAASRWRATALAATVSLWLLTFVVSAPTLQ